VIARTKIVFTPASAEIAPAARPVLDDLAKILVACPPMRLEIGGHTDAQGSEGGNQALSQARAEAVLLAMQGRRVDISGMTAVGYGESKPIADNETEAGREANRRIEFVLTGPHAAAEGGAKGAEARLEGPAPAADVSAEAGPAAEATASQPEGPDVPAAPEGPDFSAITGPSVAPTEKTIRPVPRPDGLQAKDNP
jgi:OOP family OmpA-OmpF porin